jgi:hypothetical protein
MSRFRWNFWRQRLTLGQEVEVSYAGGRWQRARVCGFEGGDILVSSIPPQQNGDGFFGLRWVKNKRRHIRVMERVS